MPILRRSFGLFRKGLGCSRLMPAFTWFTLTIVFFPLPAAPAQRQGAVPLAQGIADLADSLAKSIPEGPPMTIVVTDFPDLRGQSCMLGRYVAERLSTLLSQHSKCRLIERRRLDMVLQEFKFSMSELVDPAKARIVGQTLGLQGLVIGTTSDVGGTLDLDARIIDIQTSVSLPGASTSTVHDEGLSKLANDCSEGMELTQREAAAGSSQQGGAPTPTGAPVFESNSIRATVGQLGVSANNRRAGLSVNIENISRDPLYVAFTSKFGAGAPAAVSLSDDRATRWDLREIAGVHVVPFSDPQPNPKPNDFTLIAPNGRITVVMNFSSEVGSDETPGTVFSFGAEGTYFTPSGLQNIAIGLPGIKSRVGSK